MTPKQQFNPKASKEDMDAVQLFLHSSMKKPLFLKRVCPEYLRDIAEQLEIELDWDSMETNGWEWDYWIPATYRGTKLVISGSGFYGYGKIEKQSETK